MRETDKRDMTETGQMDRERDGMDGQRESKREDRLIRDG